MVDDFCEPLGLDRINAGYIDKVDAITSDDSAKLYLVYDFKWCEPDKSIKNQQVIFTFWWNDKEQKVERIRDKK